MVVLGWLVGAGGVAALGRDADSFARMAAKRASAVSERLLLTTQNNRLDITRHVLGVISSLLF